MVPFAQKLINAQVVFSAAFDEGVNALKDGVDILWPQKATKITMPGTEESIYGYLAEMPLFRLWEGERQPKRLKTGSYALRVRDYEISWEVGRNDMKYDRFGILSQQARGYGIAQRRFYEDLINATQAAGKTVICADGQFFYDTDHPSGLDGSGEVFSNLRTGKPVTIDNIVDGYVVMTQLKDANGKRMGVRPNIFEYGPANLKAVKEIFEAELTAKAITDALGVQNVGGVSNVFRSLVTPMLNPDLEDNVWYLHDTRVMKPFILQEESPPTGLEARDQPTDPHVWENNAFLYGARATAGAGYGLPHLSQRNETT
jgi:phage major head subunit gpT-like protein